MQLSMKMTTNMADFDSNGQHTVCIDFNGVLDQYAGWVSKGYQYPPRAGVRQFLRDLHFAGYDIVILTAVPEDARDWLANHDLLDFVTKVTNIKVPAIVYLDDRAITFNGDFDAAYKAITQFKPFWGGNT